MTVFNQSNRFIASKLIEIGVIASRETNSFSDRQANKKDREADKSRGRQRERERRD